MVQDKMSLAVVGWLAQQDSNLRHADYESQPKELKKPQVKVQIPDLRFSYTRSRLFALGC